MSSYYEFFCPVKVVAGLSAIDHIPFELQHLNAKRPLLITDQGVKKAGLLSPIYDSFQQANLTVACEFSDVPADSSFETVSRIAQLYRQHDCDALLAVGGGSVIDTAKAVNILVSEGGDDLTVYAGAHKLTRPLKPFLLLPTTAGTGSEVTSVAVIRNTTTKVSFVSYYLLPNVAILDPRMTQTLPPYITAMTAMDAMTHAIEAYTCLGHNPLSDAYAMSAIQKISNNLLTVLQSPTNPVTRLELAQASTMAGIAFSNSMVGLVHSLGHATGAVSHLPHGVCMNIFLPYVLSYNQDKNGDRIGDLLLPLAGSDVYAKTAPEQRANMVIAHLQTLRDRLYEKTKLPRTLRESERVTPEDFVSIAKKALDDGSIIYNPKEVDFDDMMAILQQAW